MIYLSSYYQIHEAFIINKSQDTNKLNWNIINVVVKLKN